MSKTSPKSKKRPKNLKKIKREVRIIDAKTGRRKSM